MAALPVAPDAYARRLASGVEEYRAEIDALLARYARGWRLERMPAVDRAVLRLAAYELTHEDVVPTAVAIAEAVELAKHYSTEDSSRYVNGVLAGVAREVRAC